MGCASCGVGFHEECEVGCEACHTREESRVRELLSPNVSQDLNTGKEGHPIKIPANVKDRQSTGRKRAAMLYPIMEHRPCEWRGMKNCGGGIPIVGCIDGMQKDCHHGPIKDTLENSPGNVHRICKLCHNRWHTVNDKSYNEEEWAKTKHDPEPADELELLANQMYWSVDPSARPANY